MIPIRTRLTEKGPCPVSSEADLRNDAVLLFGFAYLFLAVQFAWPGSFTGHSEGDRRSFLELLYFSAANLTSVGLSDVGAVRPHARAATIIEQLTGVMYIAMVISRLVALTVAKARR